MVKILFKYFFEEDILFIQIGRKKSFIGDDEFQDGVTLFRNSKTNRIVGIEIQNFSDYSNNKIELAKNKKVDFSEPFQVIREFRTVGELRHSHPELFVQYLNDRGYEQIDKVEESPPLLLKIPSNKIPDLCLEGC